ncbi:MAG: HD domain-containing protein, partial [Methermicoccaceae archaeon]
MEYSQLTGQMYQCGLERGWHIIEAKWGRKGSASLLSHSLTVMGIAEKLADIYNYSEYDRKIAVALAFLHDIGKEHLDFKEKRDYFHKDLQKQLPDGKTVEEDAVELLKQLEFTQDEIDSILHMLPHGAVEDIDHLIQLTHLKNGRDIPHVRRMVHEDADALASLKSPQDVEGYLTKSSSLHLKSDESMKLTYHSVGTVRGILTSLLHKTMHAIHEEAGWHPVMFFPEGTIYVGKADEPDFSGFEGHFARELRDFIKGLAEEANLGAEAVGSVVQTAIKSPEYLYLSETTVEQFWEKIRRQRSITDPDVK